MTDLSADMRAAIAPKSDQLNSDDLLTGPRTVTITAVKIDAAAKEQKVWISFAGDEGKPYKPCKSMARVMVEAWGPDASRYVGNSMTLFRDPTVKWAGIEVGGIRISHMSGLDQSRKMMLTETRGKKAPYIVAPLPDAPQPKQAPQPASTSKEWTPDSAKARGAEIAAVLRDCNDIASLSWHWGQTEAEVKTMPAAHQRGLQTVYQEQKARINSAPDPSLEPADEGRVEDPRAGELGV